MFCSIFLHFKLNLLFETNIVTALYSILTHFLSIITWFFLLTLQYLLSLCPLSGWIWTHKFLRCDTLLSGLLILCPHAVCLLWLSLSSLVFSSWRDSEKGNKRQRGKIYKTKDGGVGTEVKNGGQKKDILLC